MTDHLSVSVGRKEKETEPTHFVFRVWGSGGGGVPPSGEGSNPGSCVKQVIQEEMWTERARRRSEARPRGGLNLVAEDQAHPVCSPLELG